MTLRCLVSFFLILLEPRVFADWTDYPEVFFASGKNTFQCHPLNPRKSAVPTIIDIYTSVLKITKIGHK